MKVKKFATLATALQRVVAYTPIRGKFLPLSLLAAAGFNLQAAVTIPGYLKYEYFPGETKDSVESGTTVAGPVTGPGTPGSDTSGYVGSFEAGTNFADNYANRITGYFIPPTTGNYVFFLASDDDSDLFLSTDETAANKKIIATEAGWSGVRSYSTVGGTSTVEGKRSDMNPDSQWATATGTGATITLTAGKKYYIEAVHHEGGGGDNLAVTYKLDSQPDPKNGDAPRLVGSVIAADADVAPAQPHITIAVPPVGGTYYTGGALSMFVVANSDSSYPLLYQWRRNGANITGANASSYKVGSVAATNDNGSYDVVLSVPGPTGSSVSLTSAPPATIQIKDVNVEFASGVLRYDYFPGSARTDVEAGTAAPASGGATVGSDAGGFVSSFESGTNFADNYANRFSGFFLPPTTADYIFYVASDDDSDLFLSTDDNPANKKLIAQESGWSGVRIYNAVGGGSTVENKRSDSFADSEWPGANGGAIIHLTAGQKYYIEGIHHEGGGGDNFAVTYRLATESEDLTADGTAPRLTGSVIGTSVPRIMTIGAGNPTSTKFTFNIADSGASVLDPATVKLSFDGQVVTTTGSAKTTNGVTAYTYTFPASLGPNVLHYYLVQASDKQGQPVNINGTFTLPPAYFPTANLPGPAPIEKAWSTRWIFGVVDTNQTAIQITGLPSILTLLQKTGSNDFPGTVIDLTTPVINFAPNGLFADDLPYPDAVLNGNGWTGDDFIDLNIGNLKVNEEADYTFGVHSDDGFAFRIRGAQAVSVAGSGLLDVEDPEAIVEPADTGDSSTRAVYHLKTGIYRMEYFHWERGGGDFDELYVAKGAFVNDADTTTWALLGDSAFTSIQLTSAAPTGGTGGGTNTNDVSIKFTLNGKAMQITSAAGTGTVQSTDAITTTTTWTDLGAVPQTVQTGTGRKYFRIKQ